MNNTEEIEFLEFQIKELEKTLGHLKRRLEYFKQQEATPKIYQALNNDDDFTFPQSPCIPISPYDWEQAHAPVKEYDITQSSSTEKVKK